MGIFLVWMLARTANSRPAPVQLPSNSRPTPIQLPPNSRPTPAHLSDVGGDTPAAAAYSSADLIKGIENKWGKHERVQTVVTKRESEISVYTNLSSGP